MYTPARDTNVGDADEFDHDDNNEEEGKEEVHGDRMMSNPVEDDWTIHSAEEDDGTRRQQGGIHGIHAPVVNVAVLTFCVMCNESYSSSYVRTVFKQRT